MGFNSKALLLGFASLAAAQYGGGYGGGGYNPSGGGGYNPYGGGGDNANGGAAYSMASYLSLRQKVLIAHGVLAALAFVIFFPMGSILIRLGSFPGVWFIHALFQMFAYVVFIAAFACGVWLATNVPIDLVDYYHPIIGIVVFCLLFFQPILGLLHHFQFRKYNRRTIWSYGHLWLGRIIITLGMINGGLGMLLAKQTGFFVPSRGAIIAYGVIAGIMWLAWMGAALIGESRRTITRRDAEVSVRKEQYARRAWI